MNNQKSNLVLAPEIINSLSEKKDTRTVNTNMMADWVDSNVYPRFKYRERYFEPPAGPFV